MSARNSTGGVRYLASVEINAMPGELPPPFHTFVQEGPGWETLENDLKFANPYAQVFLSRVRTPTRPNGVVWTVVHRKAAVVIAPTTPDGRLLLIRQERIPIRAEIWELPAGQIDGEAEHDDTSIRATAVRELREETGYELGPDGELVPMGTLFSSPGFTDEHSHLFLARGVVPSPLGPRYDEGEAIAECRPFTVAELRRMIAENEIRDANTMSTFARLTVLGLIAP
jgi:ADP-ribose pyrophosphatase